MPISDFEVDDLEVKMSAENDVSSWKYATSNSMVRG